MLYSTRDNYLVIIGGTVCAVGCGALVLHLPHLAGWGGARAGLRLLVWIAASCAILLATALALEGLCYRRYSPLPRIQDLSLTFRGLAPRLDAGQIQAKVRLLGFGPLTEITLLYDLSEYYQVQDKMQTADEAQKAKLQSDLGRFKRNFSAKAGDYFTSGVALATFSSAQSRQDFLQACSSAASSRPLWAFGGSWRAKPVSAASHLTEQQRETSLYRSNSLTPSKCAASANLSTIRDARLRDDLHKRIRTLLGDNFEVGRAPDPCDFCFYYQRAKFTRWEKGLQTSLVLLLPTLVGWALNYAYFRLQISGKLRPVGRGHQCAQFACLAGTIALDHLAHLIIDRLIYKRKHIDLTQRHKAAMFATSAYIAIIDLLVPNFAMKAAFSVVSRREALSPARRRQVAEELVRSLRFSFCAVLFSAFNVKLLSRLRTSRKGGPDAAANPEIIFTLSFLVNSLLNVAFYSTLTPDVFVIFGVALLALFALESRRALGEERSRGVFVFSEKSRPSPLASGGGAEEEDRLPLTLYFDTVRAMIAGLGLVTALGHFGLAKPFEELGHSATLGKRLLNLLEISGLRDGGGRASALLHQLAVGSLGCVYCVFVVVMLTFYNNEALLSRLQAALSRRFGADNRDRYIGPSYRDFSPAYKLMEKPE